MWMPGNFLVLQDVADHVDAADIRADRELAHPVAVFIGVGVLPELLLEFLVVASALRPGGCPSPRIVSGVAFKSPYLAHR